MEQLLFFEINVFCSVLLCVFGYKLCLIRSQERMFFGMVCYSEALVFLVNSFSKLLDNTTLPIGLSYGANILFFIFSVYAIYMWIRFEGLFIRGKDFEPLTRKLLLVPVSITALLALCSPATGWLFYIDDSNVYHRGPLYPVQAVITFGFIFGTIGFGIFLAAKRKKLALKKSALLLSSFGTVSLVAGLIETVFPNVPLLCIAVTTSLLILLFKFWDDLVVTEYDMMMAAIKYAYPIILFVNLSKDEYHIIANTMDVASPEGSSGKFTDLINFLCSRVPEDERSNIYEHFYPINQIESYKHGQKSVSIKTRFLGYDDLMHWDQIEAIFVANKNNHDILETVLVKNIDAEMAQELQLKDARKHAEDANRAKTTFLFNMSHDIRTPMNAIIGFTSMAERNASDPDKVVDCLQKVKVSADHLLNLINNILDMARIESGNVRIEESFTDIRQFASNLTEIVAPTAQMNNISFDLVYGSIEHQHVYLDTLKVNQVLLNIASNAIKYTKPGGSVVFTVRELSERHHRRATFEFVIEDNGVGMSRDFVSHIFELFTRERNSTISGVEGSGLGMAITKQLVDMMGGRIIVDSNPGEGTSVTIHLDFKLSEGEYIPPKEDDSFNPDLLVDKHILLVEDNELNREIAGEILKLKGMTFDEAINGAEAVQMIDRGITKYDMVLMDVQMPIMDGYEATKAIRALPYLRAASLPIIAMTANAFEEDKQRALEVGMNDHIAKPINTEVMLRTMCKYI